ncbi:MAG: hypothetical protein RIQ60_3356 [Pseudomonadota bacterium]|jgi:xanthine dehydrogenase large subunit
MNQRLDLPPLATAEGTSPAATRQQPQVGVARAHESAHLHVAGRAPYTDDIAELHGTLHAALGLSPLAHGKLLGVDVELVRRQPGVVAVLTAADIPGQNDCGAIIHDDPILAADTLAYRGQPVFLVVASSRELARRAAALAAQAIRAEALEPVLDALTAHARQQYVVPPMHLARGDAAAALAAAPHRLKSRFSLGGQEQFYLEGQISYALPQEDGAVKVYCSTQHPSEMQHAVAHALHIPSNKVQVECRRMGGGFGGKESQSALFACIAAVAARQLGQPVKLRLDRDDDFLVTGRRHGFEYEFDIGYDAAGRVLGAEVTMVSNAGHSADLSAPVMTRALCHFDNAYWLPHVALHGYCARTNTQSNTAFRGFGGPQGALAIEVILDSIARQLQLDPLVVRQANFYGPSPDAAAAGVVPTNNVTPYEQVVEDNVIHELVANLVARSNYAQRRADIAAFNATSPVLKKGLALTPIKFGISFNVGHLNQAGALVHVYTDGSVLVNHGGTEMGQGLNTKVAQVVAHELGIALENVRCTATDTYKVANTSATAASTGADLNGKAAQDAARQIKARLIDFAAAKYAVPAETLHFDAGLVTRHPSSGGLLPPPGRGRAGEGVADERDDLNPVVLTTFVDLVMAAYMARIQLWSDGFYATPGLHWDRERLKGKPFFYFAYGAGVTEVIVDTLTGETSLLRADLLHDVGRSLNPALDIGQIEGAYIQGMGWLTMEELWWQPADGRTPGGGRNAGLLMTHAPSTYKIPTANDIPAVFNTHLFENCNPADSIHRSKAVGEPPLLLGFSAFLAIRDAIAAASPAGWAPPLRAPATPEAVLDALAAAATVEHAASGP